MPTPTLPPDDLRNLLFVEERKLSNGPVFAELERIVDRSDCHRDVLSRIAARVTADTPERIVVKLIEHPNLSLKSLRSLHLQHPTLVQNHRWQDVTDPVKASLEVLSCFLNQPEERRSVAHLQDAFGPIGPRALDVAVEAARNPETSANRLPLLVAIAVQIGSDALKRALLARNDVSAEDRSILTAVPREDPANVVPDSDDPPFDPTGPLDLSALPDLPDASHPEAVPEPADASRVPSFARVLVEGSTEDAVAALRDFEAPPELLAFAAGNPREDVGVFRWWDIVARHPNTPLIVRDQLRQEAEVLAERVRD